MTDRTPRKRPIKDAFFVRVPVTDGPVVFTNATPLLGKEMPYPKVQATCAMRVFSDRVLFSLLHIPARHSGSLVDKLIKMPVGALNRLSRGLDQVTVDATTVHTEIDLDDDLTVSASYVMTRDENNVARLEVIDGSVSGAAPDEDPTFTLPHRSIVMRVFLLSPHTGRKLGIGFVGHVGRPETPETLGRATGMVLNSMTGLAEFRIVAGMEAVKIAPPTVRWLSQPAGIHQSVEGLVPVTLFTETLERVAVGEVAVSIDLDTANQATGRLLLHLTPPANLLEVFEDYRVVFEESVNHALRVELGSELEMIVYEVVLGEVESGTIERLSDALATITAVDLTPRQYRHRAST